MIVFPCNYKGSEEMMKWHDSRGFFGGVGVVGVGVGVVVFYFISIILIDRISLMGAILRMLSNKVQ